MHRWLNEFNTIYSCLKLSSVNWGRVEVTHVQIFSKHQYLIIWDSGKRKCILHIKSNKSLLTGGKHLYTNSLLAVSNVKNLHTAIDKTISKFLFYFLKKWDLKTFCDINWTFLPAFINSHLQFRNIIKAKQLSRAKRFNKISKNYC